MPGTNHAATRTIVPGEPLEVELDLASVAVHVPAGSRLRLALSPYNWCGGPGQARPGQARPGQARPPALDNQFHYNDNAMHAPVSSMNLISSMNLTQAVPCTLWRLAPQHRPLIWPSPSAEPVILSLLPGGQGGGGGRLWLPLLHAASTASFDWQPPPDDEFDKPLLGPVCPTTELRPAGE
eukprot:SAG22_NODE_261_length_13373_cov_17.745472_10_plen_181_part_00